MPAEEPTTWPDVLAKFERQLEAYRACLLGGELPEPYHLPRDLGPLPSELASRARTLLELNRGIEAAMEARKARLAMAMAGRAQPFTLDVNPAFIDARV